jgi:outer membrane immunogenic protein
VAGVFADGQFGSIRGSITNPVVAFEGREKLRDSWAAGVRVGYLIAPNVYSYVNAGYSGSQWSGAAFSTLAAAAAPVFTTPSFTRNGFFVGGGVENSLNIFGLAAPGWFMKTEYRAAYYDRITLPETFVGGGLTGAADTFKPWVQTVSTSLVYRFNWTGPLVAKY